MARVTCIAAIIVASSLVTVPALAAEEQPRTDDEEKATQADPPPKKERRLQWQSSWRRFHPVQYALTGSMLATYTYMELKTPTRDKVNVRGTLFIDRRVRRAIVAPTPAQRNRADKASNFMTVFPQVMAYLDAGLVPLVSDRFNIDMAWQMSAMNLQALGIMGLSLRIGHDLIKRERPDTEPCREDPEYSESCGAGREASFPSGHVGFGMLGASLACVHHMNLPLYGGGPQEAVVCAAHVSMAVSSGILRMRADRHYLSDIVIGAGLGAFSGYVLPEVINYTGPPQPRALAHAGFRWTVAPWATPRTVGAQAVGVF